LRGRSGAASLTSLSNIGEEELTGFIDSGVTVY